LLAVAIALAAVPAAARAQAIPGAIWHDNAYLAPQQQDASATYANLRFSAVNGGSDWVGAAAHLPGGWTLYGGYVTGWQQVCHSYAAGNTLGAMMMNASLSIGQIQSGVLGTVNPC
jgi:hypothetical protein